MSYSWFLMLTLVAGNMAVVGFPNLLPGIGTAENIALSILCALLLFVFVLTHELSHCWMAHRAGMANDGILLHVFGGVSMIQSEEYHPALEFRIAAVGPLLSTAIAFVALLLRHFVFTDSATVTNVLLTYVFVVNAALAAFNLLPGLPLDGGKALRAFLVMQKNDFLHATQVAARIGRILAILLMCYGLFLVIRGNLWGVWTVLIGIFLKESASAAYRRALMESVYGSRTVQDVMLSHLTIIPPDTTIDSFIRDFLWKYPRGSFPVGNEKAVGIVTTEAAKKIATEKRSEVRVKDIMVPIQESMIITPAEPALKAYTRALQNGVGRLIVVDASGRIVGFLSLRDLMRT